MVAEIGNGAVAVGHGVAIDAAMRAGVVGADVARDFRLIGRIGRRQFEIGRGAAERLDLFAQSLADRLQVWVAGHVDHAKDVLRAGLRKPLSRDLADLRPLLSDEAEGTVKIITDQYAKEWQASAALNIVENALTQANNQVDAVVASNDGTARGAVQALEGQNLAGRVLVSGQDADLASLSLIVQGKQTMTVYKPIEPLAYAAVDAAIKLARGEKVDATDAIDNGSKKVPSVLLAPIAVDKNNIVSTVVKDGYQTLEKICANVPPEKCPKQ